MKMSHEIRTPINAINGMLHLMNNMTRTSEQQAIWEGAIRATKLLRKVVDDVLDLSKLEVGKPTLNLSQVNVVEVTSGATKCTIFPGKEIEPIADANSPTSNGPLTWTSGFKS